ncbi:MAG: bifunctional diaminohydroxyphosphoribosylaminopyrimidine deaminase/5-amino-6-(5-phosphoribosylamino)uracil reductase RibD [Candidatus Delongbacteria bacterium]|nr:bifunctional diaminohydroxyphosphoribosylaminopyrimidine deaminase/5-amino-6-(5-phosphoribosylamino)uracil reductase RibD [Candidatus Delongbacteria bacterium]MBN2836245.1 bifunctional diaminohydroxyphosphoribosylaminopyrimidine deaminase/5-amino-6-(5-phosphoribosylamino)uracil reductase RibD [Candidatus Delongbacteria bacterium]
MYNKEFYMSLALEEAKKGFGNVSPNPYVGAVIVKNGKIIGKGAHLKYGDNHAEVNAILNCTESCEDADIYVTLEPCNHHGKTPPCTERIIAEKFRKVFIGTKDYNSKVNGSGVKRLKKANIEVETGILERECYEINRHFFHHIKNNRSFVILKSAISLDGCISTHLGDSKWVTSQESRNVVHEMRLMYDGVLIGKKTAIHDNPSLTVRNEIGEVVGRTPYRILIDENLETSENSKIFTDEFKDKTIVFSTESCNQLKKLTLENRGIKVIITRSTLTGYVNLGEVFYHLYNFGIYSVMVEGGRILASELLKLGIIDRVVLFVAPKIVGSGVTFVRDLGVKKINESFELVDYDVEKIGKDLKISGTPIQNKVENE